MVYTRTQYKKIKGTRQSQRLEHSLHLLVTLAGDGRQKQLEMMILLAMTDWLELTQPVQ